MLAVTALKNLGFEIETYKMKNSMNSCLNPGLLLRNFQLFILLTKAESQTVIISPKYAGTEYLPLLKKRASLAVCGKSN